MPSGVNRLEGLQLRLERLDQLGHIAELWVLAVLLHTRVHEAQLLPQVRCTHRLVGDGLYNRIQTAYGFTL